MAGGALPEVVVYSREGCHLCEQALAGLRRLGRARPFTLREVDVDADPALAERHGDRVPVVTVGGAEVSAGPLDAGAVRQALTAHGGAPSAVDRTGGRS